MVVLDISGAFINLPLLRALTLTQCAGVDHLLGSHCPKLSQLRCALWSVPPSWMGGSAGAASVVSSLPVLRSLLQSRPALRLQIARGAGGKKRNILSTTAAAVQR